MPRIDVTTAVMANVTRWEKRRLILLASLLTLASGLLLLAVGLFSWEIWHHIAKHHPFAPLLIFLQDWEMLGLYWRDALSIAWEELPHARVQILGGLIILGVILGQITRHQLPIIKNKFRILYFKSNV